MKFSISKQMFNEVYYSKLEDYKNRFEVYYGGAGSGKSVFVSQKLILKYLKYSNRKCLVIRKIGNSIRESVFAQIKSVLSDWKIYDQCKINKTELTIELPNGSKFIFKGLDDPERIKSIADIDDIWVEECTELNDFEFDQLCLRLRSPNPHNQVFCSFNPVSKANWVYSRWFSAEADYDKDSTSILHTTYLDNRFLPQSYIDNLLQMKKSNPAYYVIYALGEFATLDKLIYTNWEVKEFYWNQILKLPGSIALFGLDFGYTNDPTAFDCLVLNRIKKEIYIFDEFQKKGLDNEEIAKKVINMGFQKEIITCDSSEPKSINELKKYGLRRVRGAVKGKDSILNGIQLLQQYKIYIHPKCVNITEEFKNYTWKKDKKTGEYINVPIDTYNHGLDALRYAVSSFIGKAKTILKVSSY